MQRRRNYWLSAILLCCLTESCTKPPPDVFAFKQLKPRVIVDKVTGHEILTADPICVEKLQEFECCYGVSIVSGSEAYVGEKKEHWFQGKKPCSQLVEESILLPAEESYAPLATFTINTCKEMHCSDKVSAFKIKLDSLNGVSGALKNH